MQCVEFKPIKVAHAIMCCHVFISHLFLFDGWEGNEPILSGRCVGFACDARWQCRQDADLGEQAGELLVGGEFAEVANPKGRGAHGIGKRDHLVSLAACNHLIEGGVGYAQHLEGGCRWGVSERACPRMSRRGGRIRHVKRPRHCRERPEEEAATSWDAHGAGPLT